MPLAGSVNSDWYLGLTIGFVLVVVVVLVVAVILSYAARIGDHALVANEGLEEVRDGTEPLWEVRKTNTAAVAILDAARTARAAVVATLTGPTPAAAGPMHSGPPPSEPSPPQTGSAPPAAASPAVAEPAGAPSQDSHPSEPQGGADPPAADPAEQELSPAVRRLQRQRAVNSRWKA